MVRAMNDCPVNKAEHPPISQVLDGASDVLTRCLNIVEDIEKKLFPPKPLGCSDPKSDALDALPVLIQTIKINEKSQRIEEILERISDRL